MKMTVLVLCTADFRMEGRSYFFHVVRTKYDESFWMRTNLGREMVESLLRLVDWADAVEMDEVLQKSYEDG
jgi:hypothetical protein